MPVAAKVGNSLKFNNAAAHRHKGVYERDPDDFYVEELGCTEALLSKVSIRGRSWDPCCGSGNIIKVLREEGNHTWATDIRSRWEGQDGVGDFLAYQPFTTRHFLGFDNIVSNPPFRKGLIIPIIEKAIATARHHVAILVPAPFLYSLERYELFQKHRPSLILHLSSRPSMPPGKMLAEGIIKATGGKEDYAWIVWERGAPAITLTDWILLPAAKAKRDQKQARAAARAGQD